MNITENFTLYEFTKSETATRKGILNVPNETQTQEIHKLVKRIIQPLRTAYNEPFIINSGFRSQELNKAVGGVTTSQHTKGQACDIHVAEPRKLLTKLLEMRLPFDQAILYPTFLHISHNSANNRKQVLYAKGVKP